VTADELFELEIRVARLCNMTNRPSADGVQFVDVWAAAGFDLVVCLKRVELGIKHKRTLENVDEAIRCVSSPALPDPAEDEPGDVTAPIADTTMIVNTQTIANVDTTFLHRLGRRLIDRGLDGASPEVIERLARGNEFLTAALECAELGDGSEASRKAAFKEQEQRIKDIRTATPAMSGREWEYFLEQGGPLPAIEGQELAKPAAAPQEPSPPAAPALEQANGATNGVTGPLDMIESAIEPTAALATTTVLPVHDLVDPVVDLAPAVQNGAMHADVVGEPIEPAIEATVDPVRPAAPAEALDGFDEAVAERERERRSRGSGNGYSDDWADRARAVPIEDVLARRGIKLKRAGAAEFEGPCPVCGTGDDRFSINTVKQKFNCRQCAKGGHGAIDLVMFLDRHDDFKVVVETLIGEPPPRKAKANDKAEERDKGQPNWNHPQGFFNYSDADGKVIYRKVRYPLIHRDGSPVMSKKGKPDKTFIWERPDSNGRWIKGRNDIPLVVYRLPDVAEAIAADRTVPVFFAEGEAKADLLWTWGLTGTSVEEGTTDFAEQFRDVPAVILPDNDKAGRDYVDFIGRNLSGIAASARVLLLPGLGKGEDIADWVAKSGGTREQLDALLEQARDWGPSAGDAAEPPHPAPSLILRLEDWLGRDLPEPDRVLGHLLTTTSRIMMSAPTGLGKTMFNVALGFGTSHGNGFLHWPGVRPATVLFVDGEMSRRLLKQRLADEVKRFGKVPAGFHILSHEDVEGFQPFNTATGQAFINSVIARVGADFVFFDNIMSLTAGDMKDELAWAQTVPLVKSLTKRKIGQLWVHHTGHDTAHSYGTKTREWLMDTVIHLEPVEREDTDVSFAIKFPKARERTPDNRQEFAENKIWLLDDRWHWCPANGTLKGKISPQAQKFLDALEKLCTDGLRAYGVSSASLADWKAECIKRGLIDGDAKDARSRATMSRNKIALITANRIVTDEEKAWILP